MPSPFFSTDSVYGLRRLLGTSNIDDIDAGIAALADDIVSKMKPNVPVVTAIPTVGPTGSGPLLDGQECYLQVDATNGVQWHLRYRSSSASAYKWEFVGGPPLLAEVMTSDVGAGSGYGALSHAGPVLTLPTLPSGGDFDVEIGGTLLVPSSGDTAKMSYKIGAAAAVDADSVQVGSAGFVEASVARLRRKTALATGIALTAQYAAGNGASTFANRFMRVTPVRVG